MIGRRFLIGSAGLALLASAALAHQGVTNEAVKARMDAMEEIGRRTRTIGQMAKGERAFDADAARSAAAGIAQRAAEVPALFEARETDPQSEARPAIWDSFADFSARSEMLEEVAAEAATGISSQADLGPVLGALGKTCSGCHELYRLENE